MSDNESTFEDAIQEVVPCNGCGGMRMTWDLSESGRCMTCMEAEVERLRQALEFVLADAKTMEYGHVVPHGTLVRIRELVGQNRRTPCLKCKNVRLEAEVERLTAGIRSVKCMLEDGFVYESVDLCKELLNDE